MTLSSSDCAVLLQDVGWWANNELERWRKWSWPNLRSCPSITWRDWGKPQNETSLDGWSQGQYLKLGPPEFEATVLATWLQPFGKVGYINEIMVKFCDFNVCLWRGPREGESNTQVLLCTLFLVTGRRAVRRNWTHTCSSLKTLTCLCTWRSQWVPCIMSLVLC
jgi:hypothetical protein